MQRVSFGVGAALLALVAGCWFNNDDDDGDLTASWTEMSGAPYAVTGMSFDASGVPIVMGGGATFGEYFLQRPRASDGLWVRAEGVPMGSFGDPVFRVGGVVYAVMSGEVVRLDDEESFTWTALGNPAGERPIAVTADEVVYAMGGRRGGPEDTYQQVLLSWSKGQSEWAVVPGSETAVGFHAVVVEPGGRVTTSTQNGFYRGDAGGVSQIFDCNEPEYRYCESQISQMVIDDAGELSFLVCPFTVDQRAIFRLPADGGEVYKAADVPPEFAFCKQLYGLPGGDVFLFAAEDNLIGAAGALFRLAPGGSALQTVALGIDADYGHAVRDSATLFRFGDAGFVTGVAYRGI